MGNASGKGVDVGKCRQPLESVAKVGLNPANASLPLYAHNCTHGALSVASTVFCYTENALTVAHTSSYVYIC